MKTYSQLLYDIQMFPYNDEVWEAKKEANELNILNAYIDNQLYIRENFSDISSDSISLLSEAKAETLSGTVLTQVKKVGQMIFDLFIKLLKMIRDGLSTIINFLEKRFASKTCDRAAAAMREAIGHGWDAAKEVGQGIMKDIKDNLDTQEESTIFEANKNTSTTNKIAKVFVSAYKKARMKFEHINLKKNKGILKNAIYNKDILISYKNKGDIQDFFINDKTTDESIMKTQAKMFIDFLQSEFVNVTFHFSDSFAKKFPVISIEDFITATSNMKYNFASFSDFWKKFNPSEQIISTTGITAFMYFLTGNTNVLVKGTLSMLGIISVSAVTVIGAMYIYDKLRAVYHSNKQIKGVRSINIDYKKSCNKLVREITDAERYYQDQIETVAKGLAECVKDKDIAENINNSLAKKDRSILSTIKEKMSRALGVDKSSVKYFTDGDKINQQKVAEFYRYYYQIAANLMTLIDAGSQVYNIMYTMASEVASSVQ